MPVVLGLLFMIAESKTNTAIMALVLFYIITVMVGSYMAGEEIPNEIQEKTWDWQRMSALNSSPNDYRKAFGFYYLSMVWRYFLYSHSFVHGNNIINQFWGFNTIYSLHDFGCHAFSIVCHVTGNRYS
ncbi:MAG: hypothetical protein KatS3mg035_0755 [Bacteroidia bacterium]|nr:MAG: hypothetical protein KatS3mg035_0755 [Bacteroidia bacterium]